MVLFGAGLNGTGPSRVTPGRRWPWSSSTTSRATPSLQCVEDWQADGAAEVVIVDNGSADGSVDRIRAHHPDLDSSSRGATSGTARPPTGVSRPPTAPLVLVSNPDLEVRPGALAGLVGALADRPRVRPGRAPDPHHRGGAVPVGPSVPRWSTPAGHALLGIFAPDNRFTRSYQRSELDGAVADPVEVDWVSGACFLVRRSAFEQVGGFDESLLHVRRGRRPVLAAGPVRLAGRLRAGGRGHPPAGACRPIATPTG